MHNTLNGEARLESMEGEISIVATIDKFGHVNYRVGLRHPSGEWHTDMQLELENDQTILSKVAKEAAELERPWRPQ